MNKESITKEFTSLIAEGETVKAAKRHVHYGPDQVDEEKWREWSTKVVEFTRSVFGTDRDIYKQASGIALSHGVAYTEVVRLFAVLRGAAAVWERGYAFDSKQLAESAVESDFIDQAQELLDKNHYQAAAVLGGITLERHLRSLCTKYNVADRKPTGEPKAMSAINNDLYSAGAYGKTERAHVDSLVHIRNRAAHGEPPDITKEEAERMTIGARSLCANLT